MSDVSSGLAGYRRLLASIWASIMMFRVICTCAQPSDFLEILERPEEDDLTTTLHACTYVVMNSAMRICM